MPSSALILEPCGRRCGSSVPCRGGQSFVLSTLIVVGLWSNCYLCKKKLFFCGLGDALTNGYKEKNSRISLLLCLFRTIIIITSTMGKVLDFLVRAMI